MGQLLDLIYINRIDTTEQFNGTGDVHIEQNSFYTLPLKYRIKKVTLMYDNESMTTTSLWTSFELNEEASTGSVTDGLTVASFLDNLQANDTAGVFFYPSSKFQLYGELPNATGITNVYTVNTDIFVDGTKQPLNFYEYYTSLTGSNPAAGQIFSFVLVMTVEVL